MHHRTKWNVYFDLTLKLGHSVHKKLWMSDRNKCKNSTSVVTQLEQGHYSCPDLNALMCKTSISKVPLSLNIRLCSGDI